MPPAPRDELPHGSPGGDASEAWTFDFATADGQLGGWVRYVRFADRAWYHAVLAGPNRQLLAVLDDDVPFRSSPMEVRTTGLWADHVCETPFEHWTLGLEAFALGVDDPAELLGRQHGDLVPLGFDLEWETDGPVQVTEASPGVDGYEVACRVQGELLVGAAVHDLDAVGTRAHTWGAVDWWGAGGWHLTAVLEGAERWSVDHRDGATTACLTGPDGTVRRGVAVAAVQRDADGLPTGGRVEAQGSVLAGDVLAVAPVPLRRGAQRSWRPIALCRYRSGDGRIGVGWLEVRGPGGALPRRA